MKKVILFLVLILSIMSFGVEIIENTQKKRHTSGIGEHLMTIYEHPVPLPASLQGKKVTKIPYKGDDYYNDNGIKFVVHQNGVKLKLERVEYRELSDGTWKLVTLETLFTHFPKKGQVYSFNGVLPEGVPTQALILEYKGKKIKYSLHYGLRIRGVDEEQEDLEVVEFYSGDTGEDF